MDDPFFVLKMASLSCAATFCIAATMIGLGRGDDAAPRRARAVAIAAIAFAALTIGIHWIEIRKHADSATAMARQALEASARLEGKLAELERAVQPIESVSIRAQVFVSMRHPLLRSYGEHFDKGVAAILSEGTDFLTTQRRGLVVDMVRTSGDVTTPITVGIREAHDLFPTRDAFAFARHVLDVRFSEVAFFRSPVDPGAYLPFIHGVATDPDLRIGQFGAESLEIHKNLDSGQFFLSGNLTFDKALWDYKTNRVASMLDLAGTQMFIAFGPLKIETQGLVFEEFLEARREFDIDWLSISFGNRHRMIEKDALKRHVTRTGLVFWEYRFPDEPSGLFHK